MSKMIKFIVLSNLVAWILTFTLESTTSVLGLRYLADYAFFNVFILWGLAAVLYMYPPQGGIGISAEKAERVADSMVDRSAVDEVDNARFDKNADLYLKLFISGIFPVLICLAQSVLY